MFRKEFLNKIGLLSGMALLSPKAFSYKPVSKIHFWRHATLVLEINGVRFLVDPMLSAKDAMDTVKVSRNTLRIPMTSLPFSETQLLSELAKVDAVVVTHTHRDHWDETARTLLQKDIPLICQPSDSETLTKHGFTNLLPVPSTLNYRGVTIHRTGGQHGTGEIGQRMGTVSGFVLEGDKKIYVAGDTIWCSEVEQALKNHAPDVTIVNAGAAHFDQGDPITMNAEDVAKVCRAVPKSQVVAVHMETVNHCSLKRDDLRSALQAAEIGNQCWIPADGERKDL